ncbi:MAG: molybdate ABC transporter substrate-binding protein [Gammaproteobacteria bacterium]|nr:molybdate ABC transporter substrate-binding protein [Gammaproteobacteria bacterium]
MFDRRATALCLALLLSATVHADVVTVAVASNFRSVAEDIARVFEADTAHRVRLAAASTGTFYAQISNGAPFDVLLAADSERPAKLVATGLAVSESRFTYAIGSLVLWSRDLSDCQANLREEGETYIAIANPLTAPYGQAAREYLLAAGLWEPLQPRLVIAQNIAQALQFTASGNAGLGFVARAQTYDERLPAEGCSWEVPADMHAAIEQQAILLRRAIDNPAAIAWLKYLQSEAAKTLIRQRGYGLPQ